MSRHLVLTQERIFKLQKEGRGLGEGASYKPWIQVDDFPSQGRCHRIQDILTGRVHHFFSDLEADFYYIIAWNSNVLDIREQYPLPTVMTEQIATSLGVVHPKCRDRSSYVMTTDFLITYRDSITGKIMYCARSVKPMSELSNKRTLQKQQIEQLYWKSNNVDWKCVTENSFLRIKAKNIRKMLAHYNIFQQDQLTENIGLALMERIFTSEYQPLQSVCDQICVEQFLEQGEALSLFYYLVAHRQIVVDLNSKIWPTMLVKDLVDLDALKETLTKLRREHWDEACSE
jgi:TnsA endonuclease C terminal./TnsA endonuclease N terminal.